MNKSTGASTGVEYTACYQLSRDDQMIASGDKAALKLGPETLTVAGDFGDVWTFSYRRITRLQRRDYRVHVQMAQEDELILYQLGRHYEGFWRDLTEMRNELLISDSLVGERNLFSGIQGSYQLCGEEDSGQGECEIRLYETALMLLSEGEGIITRVPYGLISEVSAENYSLTVATDYGDDIILSAMGRQTDAVEAKLSEALNRLNQRTAEFLLELVPDIDPVVLRQLGHLLRDGRLAKKESVEAVSAGLWSALQERLAHFGCRGEYDYLRSISSSDSVYLGFKRGLMGDLTGEYLWFLIPVHGETSGTDSLLAMEVAGGEGGRATYFFRIAGPGERSGRSPEQLSESIDRASMQINRCMLSINFRREPIYLPEEKLTEKHYQRYAYAVDNLRPLRKLRQRFVGRVIHRSQKQWQEDVDDLLKFSRINSDPEAMGGASEKRREY